ncbi:MAG: 4a-hydroxytetrahydrobiopterin dehydratase [Brachybacterium sp.]|uniref:4a-hydroxytetrahydrobiopterin dehydratase n=1 Tax=Brachybacterium sp. Z12 TaxID=2759167 RepID=UPI001807FE77|nr:4a-hydroxytetrahydrobiopterin dehydratase [Brachybacterium sp. Z12]NMA78739.1 4a-hydroxytetrahydrobiopterin dehydratase [Actinomycetales bacterium]QNN81931.1 4a-hydroxytetrahydrobiopterin dehydratase [Brachybacterium sp. Z12]
MADPKQTLTASEISAAALADWRQDGGTLTARFATADFATGLELVNRIGASAEEANHHPDLTLTYPQVTVTLSSHDVGGITSRDIDLARTISDHAATLRVSAEQGAEQG